MLFSIIVLTRNRQRILGDCLQCVRDVSPECPREVIVVDNGSDEDPRLSLQARFPDVTWRRLAENRGVTGGRNVAIREATGEVLVFLDDDCFVAPDLLAVLLRTFATHPAVGIVACCLLDNGTRQPTGWTYYPRCAESAFKTFQAHTFSGGACAIRREVFDRVGLLDERFLYGAEETDFSLRVLDAGFDILYVGDARICHEGADRQQGVSPRAAEHLHHVLYYLAKNLPFATLLRYALRVVVSNRGAMWRVGVWGSLKCLGTAVRDIRRDRALRHPISAEGLRRLRELERSRPGLWHRVKCCGVRQP